MEYIHTPHFRGVAARNVMAFASVFRGGGGEVHNKHDSADIQDYFALIAELLFSS
jgi:hypothetical protein